MTARTGCSLLEMAWGTRSEALRLGCEPGPRHWAYAWIEKHLMDLCGTGYLRNCADLGGGGIYGQLAGRLSLYAYDVLIVDKMGEAGKVNKNIRQVVCDFEKGLDALADDSIDVIVSASALEHLTATGQNDIFAEINRVLRPGGYFCGTVSYICGLTENALALIAADPAFQKTGSPVFAPFNAREALRRAGVEVSDFEDRPRSHYPGFDGFSEDFFNGDEDLLYHLVGSYGEVRCTKAVDDLRLPVFELGLFFRKEPGAASEPASGFKIESPPGDRHDLNINGSDLLGAWQLNLYGDTSVPAGRKLPVVPVSTEGDHLSLPYFRLSETEPSQPAKIWVLTLAFPQNRSLCSYKYLLQDGGCNAVISFTGSEHDDDGRKIVTAGLRLPPETKEARLVLCPATTGEYSLPEQIMIRSTDQLVWPSNNAAAPGVSNLIETIKSKARSIWSAWKN